MTEAMQRYQYWLSQDLDEATRKELIGIQKDPAEIEDRFFRELEFGTAGARGVLGAGSNRMNVYTVRKITQGLAEYIAGCGEEAMQRGVVVAYDSRHMSEEFSLEVSRVLAGNGIRVYLFDELRPTPELSFAIRELSAIAGVNITASHNPAKYNGYKVYWSDGGQMGPEAVQGVVDSIAQNDGFHGIQLMDAELAKRQGKIIMISREIDDVYVSRILGLSRNPQMIKNVGQDFKLTYTPLHGAGNKLVRRVLQEAGFEKVHVVREQEAPNGDFPTVKAPNPEERDALRLALALARVTQSDLVLATDPDSDRMGAAVKDEKGEFQVLTGNQIGCLLLNYLLEARRQSGDLPQNGAVVKSIVSTNMADAIAANYGMTLYDVLTGFKFISEKIEQFEKDGSHTFLFGFEESFGYLAGTFARDKDAVAACLLMAEVALWYSLRGMSLYQGLQELYQQYGYYKEKVVSFEMDGSEGLVKIKAVMDGLRNHPPKALAGKTVLAVRDYDKRMRKDLTNGQEGPLQLPRSNVLYYEMEDDAWFAARPSGTEPKIKLYLGVREESEDAASARADAMAQEIHDLAAALAEG
ncbi:phospho-sugar mutase [Gehongia tenuis]|uniref:Phosphoglucomutase n=1 Tax=Gehongia tenuis TaxID=2763655 RepID=A0A926D6N7_9FIRM|nr:phospho-sugar mutase [Gehongia tenuis]MBC8532332.1 phospho-sugar mutase [Gehongia tenuis]